MIDPETRTAIVEDIRTGGTCRGIARKHRVSPASVRRIADEANIKDPFERTATENATRAKVADMAARRAELAQLLLEDAFELRQRARSEYEYYERGQLGAELVKLKRPPLRETREAYTALGIAVDKSKHLLQQDADTSGAAAVDAWLRDMIGDVATQAARQHP